MENVKGFRFDNCRKWAENAGHLSGVSHFVAKKALESRTWKDNGNHDHNSYQVQAPLRAQRMPHQLQEGNTASKFWLLAICHEDIHQNCGRNVAKKRSGKVFRLKNHSGSKWKLFFQSLSKFLLGRKEERWSNHQRKLEVPLRGIQKYSRELQV